MSPDQRAAEAAGRNAVLVHYRAAASLLRAGRHEEAKAHLDAAIARIGGLVVNDAAAQRARSLFAAESEKAFLGEPYERAMAYYYRGLLYWRDGELDNARACFRSAQFIDSAAAEEAYRGDFVLMEYLDGLATRKLDGDGSDALRRAREIAQQALPDLPRDANVMVFAEYGRGPEKFAAGQHGEQLRFRPAASRVRSASLMVDGRTIHLTAWDNLAFQAMTRGGRLMDHVLGNKAVFKDGADALGNAALAGAVIAGDNIYNETEGRGRGAPADRRASARRTPVGDADKNESAEAASVALGVIGLLGKAASAATIAEADTRTWDNLPQYLSFAALQLRPGEHPARLEFHDVNGRVIPELTRSFTLQVPDPGRDTVVILSEHNG